MRPEHRSAVPDRVSPRAVPAVPDPAPPAQPAAPVPPERRRRAVFGLAAEAAAQAEARQGRNGNSPNGAAALGTKPPLGMTMTGVCPCGLPASLTCAGGCGRPTCGEHLLNRASRLGWAGPYRSEREHTAYLRGFWGNTAPLCAWCRETAGNAAVGRLAPVAELPADVIERLLVLLRRPYDYPSNAWERTVQEHGGAAAVLRVVAPLLTKRKAPQTFEGRRSGEYLTGVSLGTLTGRKVYEVVDRDGAVWTVRPLSAGLVRKRRAWAWEPIIEPRVTALLPRVMELATP